MLLELPDDLEVPTCTACGAMFISRETARKIDEALSTAYARELRVRAKELVEGLTKHRSAWSLEWLLGLSQGYLSRIKHEKRTPSTALVACLALLAENPPARIEALESFWGVGNLDEHLAKIHKAWAEDEAADKAPRSPQDGPEPGGG